MNDFNLTEDVKIAAGQSVKERKYWLNKLSAETPRSAFPRDYTRRENQEPEYRSLEFSITGDLFSRLAGMTKGSDYMLHIILVTELTLLLARYTDNHDIVLGAPIDKQEKKGDFVNTALALRNTLQRGMSFKALLMQARATIVEASEHQNYPLRSLLFDLDLEYSENEFPLFDVAVLLENIQDISYINHIRTGVTFSFLKTDQKVRCNLVYDSAAYKEETVGRISRHFLNLLQNTLFNVEVEVFEAPVMTEEEREQLLTRFNDTAAPYPEQDTIHGLFRARAQQTPDAAAVSYIGEAEDSSARPLQSMTYRELDRKSDQIAALLRQKGVNAGTAVGIMVERSLEMIIGLLGILKADGVYLPIDPQYPGERKVFLLEDSKAAAILTQPHLMESIAFDGQWIDLEQEDIYRSDEPVPGTIAGSDHLAYIIFTSGSTGKPKGVQIRHKSIVNTLHWRKNYYAFDQSDAVLQIPAFTFDSSVEDIFTPLISGSHLVLIPTAKLLEMEYLKNVFRTVNITHFLITPALYKLFLGEIHKSLDALKSVTVAGDNFNEELVIRHFEKLPHVKIVNEYGPTENSVCSTVYQFTADNTKVIIGKPLNNVQCYVLNGKMELLPLGAVGELCVGGAGLAVGYQNNSPLTDEKFVPNPFEPGSLIYRTGDLARWLPDGNLEFAGRVDAQVKIRGFRIELEEIETLLLEQNHVEQAVVVAKEDDNGEKTLCAFYVATSPVEADALRDNLSQKLPVYMVPAFFTPLEKIPLTPNGKIDRKALMRMETATTKEFVAPRDKIEEKLADIWASLLETETGKIGIDDSFFELGGHSLSATVIVSKIHREFGVKVPLVEFFKTPDIRGLAHYLTHASGSGYEVIEPVETRDYYEQSSAQKRLFFMEQFEHIGTTYNIPRVTIIEETVDREKFQHTVNRLVRRHETLRTSFLLMDNQAVQRVHPEIDFSIRELDCKGREVKEIIVEFVQPFKLSEAPLLRIGLGTMDDGKSLLLFDMHHIISDGVSMDILVNDFIRLYHDEELAPLNVQYKDFAVWQNELSRSGKIALQEKYWLDLYADMEDIPKLDLPIDYPRPAVFQFEGDDYHFKLDAENSARFKRLSIDNTATLFMSLLAAYNALLYKYSGNEAIVVGCDIAGRPHADLEHIIGMFVNELAMRNHPRGNKTFSCFVNEVKDNSLRAFENQDYQFEELVDKLNVERDPARNPLFDVEFVMQIVEKERDNADELAGASYEYRNKTTKFDIALDAYEVGDQIHFRFQYSTKLFKKQTVRNMAQHYLNVLRTTAANPEIRLEDIDILDEDEKRKLLFDFNDTKKELHGPCSFPLLFQQQVEKTPDRIAVTHKQTSLSYRRLDEKANQLANYLHHEKNIGPNDRVAIWMDRSIDFLVAILGIMKAGGAYIPIEPLLPEERIKRIIDNAEVGVVISGEKYNGPLNRLQWECPTFNTYLCMDRDETPDAALREEEEFVVKTAEELWNYVVKTAKDEITQGGWFSSYTGQPFSEQEMGEYGDNTIEKITPLLRKDMRVLEIGCASGLTMYRIAPQVQLYYGTDISSETIEKNKLKLKNDPHHNIKLQTMPAHEIDTIDEKEFDLIIINSVIQSFHGHSYLGKVLRKAVNLLGDSGYLYLGDVMDQDLKQVLVKEMCDFKQADKEKKYNTKTDWAAELFISRDYFRDLAVDIPAISKVDFSDKIHTIENELTKFRYDTLLTIDKTTAGAGQSKKKSKYQHGLCELNRQNNQNTAPAPGHDDLAYMIYTSGTTGVPKGVMIHQRGMINHLHAKINDLGIQSEDFIAQTASAGFDISVWQFLAALPVGGRTLVFDKEVVLDPPRFLKELQQLRISILETVPSLMSAFLEVVTRENDKALQNLRWMIPTGEPLTPHLARLWYKHYPTIKLVNAYGPTEASDDVTHYILHRVPAENETSVPIGKPLQNLHIYILDKNVSLCPVGVRGEICVAGIGVGKGYWKDEEKTAKAFIPNPFIDEIGDNDYATIYKTGDIGYLKPDGTVECLGRLDHQVKIRGNRIELGDIERQLLKHDDINEAVVIVKEDDEENKFLCSYFVPTTQQEPNTEDLTEFLSMKLPDYMIPAYFVPLDEIPVTPNGKLDVKALPAPELQQSDEYIAPQNETEEKLAAIWGRLLGIKQDTISMDANFFHLGGHSLKVTILIAQIRKEFDVKIPLAGIFNEPTIKGIASLINVYKWADDKKDDTKKENETFTDDDNVEEIVI